MRRQACVAVKETQDSIFELIGGLPEKIQESAEYLELYKTNAKLKKATYELYVKVLFAIEGMIYWLTSNEACEIHQESFVSSAYGPSLFLKALVLPKRRIPPF